MRIAIIGAGFTGLTATQKLLKNNHQVVLLEKASFLGGLAAGIQNSLEDIDLPWEWDLEQFYHHWFTNDRFVFDLAKDNDVTEKLIIKRPITSILYQDQIYPFDSPLNLLKFPHLSIREKINTGQLLARLKYFYNQENTGEFEKISAAGYLQKHSSPKVYKILWQPLLQGKFGDHYQTVNMRWFWARIHKRTSKLAYYQGGFSAFAQDLALNIHRLGGKIVLNALVKNIQPDHDQVRIDVEPALNELTQPFDKVIVTTPPYLLTRLIPNLPDDYSAQIQQQSGLGALVLILSLHHPLMDKTYWLNVNDLSWPFLAVVEHTNFMDKKHYNNENLVYVGNYLDRDHPYMRVKKHDLIHEFTPYLKKINPLFSDESIIRSLVFKTPYAQPIPGLNHQEKILPFETPMKNVYLASMAQVYPWDRGTNYAIELGQKVAELIK